MKKLNKEYNRSASYLLLILFVGFILPNFSKYNFFDILTKFTIPILLAFLCYYWLKFKPHIVKLKRDINNNKRIDENLRAMRNKEYFGDKMSSKYNLRILEWELNESIQNFDFINQWLKVVAIIAAPISIIQLFCY